MSLEAISTLLNFTVVAGILYYAGRKPISEFFQTRSRTIGTEVDEARRVSGGAHRDMQEWDRKMRGASEEIHRQFEDTRTTMAKSRELALTRAHSETKRISEESTLMIAAEQAGAKRSLRRQLGLESIEQARQYMTSHMDKKDGGKLLTDNLERVSHGHSG